MINPWPIFHLVIATILQGGGGETMLVINPSECIDVDTTKERDVVADVGAQISR